MKKALTLFGIVALAATSFLSLDLSADAAKSQCASGSGCIWRDINFSGGLLHAISTPSWTSYSAGTNDLASSLYNNSTRDVAWYSDHGLQGGRKCAKPNHQLHSLSGTWNDSISSVIMYSGTKYC